MRVIFTFLLAFTICINALIASGPSTYFNIYLPPNNDAVQRNVALIVTALYDETSFTITDDGADGDADDSFSGTLSAGQSYILYIKDNGINDDAQYASGGTLKRDGDYFIINSSKLVFASMSTDSDWQHDFVPSVNKTSLGEKFIIYAPKISSSKRDLNVFAYENNTTITISKISASATQQTGYTNIDLNNKTIIKQRTLNVGQDIIHFYQDGRDVMETGETYMIEANKPVSVQYGALWTNARDGGGYVPSSNGSSSGDLFYFAVPYQANGEQEIRIGSWDNANAVKLERYDNGTWIVMNNWTLDRLKPADWIGKRNNNATYPTVFRISCTPGKTVSVFECNWMETGSPGTSDMASMVSSETGTDAGKEFLVYLLPPGKQNTVVNPFTGNFFGGNFAHCYLYAGNKATTVTIKDAKTNGAVINRTYNIEPNRYADAFFSLDEWKSIYNGNGNPDTGPERPYVLIEANNNISVMNANTNDNWMMYFGSSLPSAFSQVGSATKNIAIPGDTIKFESVLTNGTSITSNPNIVVSIGSGAVPISSKVVIGTSTVNGQIEMETTGSTVSYNNIPNIAPNQQITITTNMVITPSFNNGDPIPNNTVITVQSTVTGTVDNQIHQSTITEGIQDQSSNLSQVIYSSCVTGEITESLTDSWSSAWIDYNNDTWEDLYVTDRNQLNNNQLYRNNGNGNFTKITSGPLVNTAEKTVSSAWGDYNNDGNMDVFVVNATGTSSKLYKNTNGNFSEVVNSGIDTDPQYFHGAAWFDMDNDGYLDLVVTNFFETKFHHVYKNNKNGTFTRMYDSPIALESNRSTMPALADYNNDGLVDVFIPNGDDKPNSLFKNLGNGRFEKITNDPIVTDATNSVGATWGDYDNDGWMDLVVLNASNQDNLLYKNNGNGTFAKITNTIITKEAGNSHSAAWMDNDNDGDLDLLITNDKGAKFYYINNGVNGFSKKYDEIITADFGNAMGIAVADYNKNGKLDAYISTHSGQPNRLFCNQSANTNKFLNIRLVGTSSNKSAIGATIRLKANGYWQMRQVLPVQGLGSQNSIRQHFGVAQAAIIDSVEIKWPSGYIQKISNLTVNQFISITEENANALSGFAFDDQNANCIWDNNEPKIANVKFKALEGYVNFTTLNEGAYQLRLPNGNQSISIQPNNYWRMDCPVTVNMTGNGTYTANLPLTSTQNGYDLTVNTAVTAWRRGFANETVLSYSNDGTSKAYNTKIQITYPDQVELKWASTPWSEKIGNTYFWNIDTLASGANLNIQLRDSVLLTTVVGQEYPISSSITANGSDMRPSNNARTENIEVVGAVDPNDIIVTPKGAGKEGFVDKDQVLTYLIRFQNVGTYYASRIILENQLSEYLDLSTFALDAVSHPGFTYTVSNTGMLYVKFDNINLPDSTRDEPGSHGFFKYSISPKKDIRGGSRIENSALITFDFEDALLTNMVVNTIKFGNSSTKALNNLLIFPNPAVNEINIIGESPDISDGGIPALQSIQIRSLDGQVVAQISNQDTLLVHQNIEKLAAGIYIVVGSDANGIVYQGKFVKI
ncbi:MAG: hypothetical protein RIR11_2649 [Bacteroidota bacterium]